jgi:molecular chaperone DnaK (HSP70)
MTSFYIGIDLGTTNSALAFVQAGGGKSGIFAVPQAETTHSTASHDTLPSFLLRLPQSEDWTIGRLARERLPGLPGRVVQSAKSWLVHHASDPHAPFLPFGSTELEEAHKLSPVDALARILRHLRESWDSAHPEAPLERQSVVVTVPASFDPLAQQLTLEAAHRAGLPASTSLLEEPQAAFLAWLERPGAEAELPAPGASPLHVLVVDIGGGTTDFSLFEASVPAGADRPRLVRLAVSGHILLGGDNFDLSIAHALEPRFGALSAPTFASLVARCRDVKESALSESGEETFTIAVARSGASLLAGSLQTTVARDEVRGILLDGFLPDVVAGEEPLRAPKGLREMGLPYAKDAAITRHLADFLRDRPPVDLVLFNGGITKSRFVRDRILANVSSWQPGHAPRALSNEDPDLAVARGAAWHAAQQAHPGLLRVEGGSAHAYYLDIGGGRALCILAHGTEAGVSVPTRCDGLAARIGEPVSFALLRHNRHEGDRPGTVVLSDVTFEELPSLEAVLHPPKGRRATSPLPVDVRAALGVTGLLGVEIVANDKKNAWKQSWPLVFALRGGSDRPTSRAASASEPVLRCAEHWGNLLSAGRKTRQKPTANLLFQSGEKILQLPKARWSGGIVRALYDQWIGVAEVRRLSPEHEESWLHLSGWLLRPGCGMTGDGERVSALQPILAGDPCFSSGAVRLQRWIAARRIAGGLEAAQSLSIWSAARSTWREGSPPPAEIALLAGSLEWLPGRDELARHMVAAIQADPRQVAYWRSLGRLLARQLLNAGVQQVLPPELVGECWDVLPEAPEAARTEATAAWLRAARLTGVRALDLDGGLRKRIDATLRRWDVPESKRRVLTEHIPLVDSDRAGMLGESPPPGIMLNAEPA